MKLILRKVHSVSEQSAYQHLLVQIAVQPTSLVAFKFFLKSELKNVAIPYISGK